MEASQFWIWHGQPDRSPAGPGQGQISPIDDAGKHHHPRSKGSSATRMGDLEMQPTAVVRVQPAPSLTSFLCISPSEDAAVIDGPSRSPVDVLNRVPVAQEFFWPSYCPVGTEQATLQKLPRAFQWSGREELDGYNLHRCTPSRKKETQIERG